MRGKKGDDDGSSPLLFVCSSPLEPCPLVRQDATSSGKGAAHTKMTEGEKVRRMEGTGEGGDGQRRPHPGESKRIQDDPFARTCIS